MIILIKDMEMPREGTVMVVCEVNGQPCVVVRGAEPYPLVHVPPHGRLIDADALEEDVADIHEDVVHCGYVEDSIWGFSHEMIENAPTIIPADPAKEETE